MVTTSTTNRYFFCQTLADHHRDHDCLVMKFTTTSGADPETLLTGGVSAMEQYFQ